VNPIGRFRRRRREPAEEVEERPNWLSRLVMPYAGTGSERLRDGRLLGILLLAAGLYSLMVLPELHPHVTQAAILTSVLLLSALTVPTLPWQRLPEYALQIPVVVGILILSLGYGTAFGDLNVLAALYAIGFGFTGLVLPPGHTAFHAGLSFLGLTVAAVFGNQHDHIVEIAGSIAVSGFVGELVAGAVSVQRQHRSDLERLQTGLTGLLAADDQEAAATLISHLTAELLRANGVTVITRVRPGSPWLTACGGYGAGANFTDVRLDIDAEKSGVGIAARTLQPLFIADVWQSPLVSKRHLAAVPAASTLYLPISGQREVLGLIIVWWLSPIAALDGFAEQVVRLLSIQAGLVLERVRQVEDLDRAAATDALTGISNRRVYEQQLENLPVDAVLIICDLDRFKILNDTKGHQAGDRVLRSFAAVAASSVRDGDLVSRIGGDEFALLVQGGLAAADAVLERLAQAWARPEGVGFSAGRAVRRPNETGDQLSERADQDLYVQKRRIRQQTPGGSI
jgi:diguanylate cyclase (GGDEF)-like protein